MNAIEEIWLPIPNYEDFYLVSNIGNIKGLNYRGTGRSQNLILTRNKQGYVRIHLQVDNICKGFMAHRLVAMTFIPNPNNKKEVNHINGIKHDNRIENLEWVTPKENTSHAIRTGLSKGNPCKYKGIKRGPTPASYKPVIQMDKDDNFIQRFESMQSAVIALKLNAGKISEVCSGKRKTTGGFKFKIELK